MTLEEPATVSGTVASVSRDAEHRFSKPVVPEIRLLDGLGIEGDAHAGATVQHRYLLRKDRTLPNLTQVHLIPAELFRELAVRGFDVSAGDLGENITTRGIELRTLPLGTILRIGGDAVVEVTGLRNPCSLINKFQKGLMKAVIDRDPEGGIIRRAGIMGIVVAGGIVRPGDGIGVELPAGEPVPLGVV